MKQFDLPSISAEGAELLSPLGHQLLGTLALQTRREREFVCTSNQLLNELVPNVCQPLIAEFARNVYNNLQGLSRDPYTYSTYLHVLGTRAIALYSLPRAPLIEEIEQVWQRAVAQGCVNPVVLTAYMRTASAFHHLPGVISAWRQGAAQLDEHGSRVFFASLLSFTDTAELAGAEEEILALRTYRTQQRATIHQLCLFWAHTRDAGAHPYRAI
jgi:hypothetical protein